MTTPMDGHVRIDGGVHYVGNTRLKLIHLAMSYAEEGGSVEGPRAVYDWLPIADLYGALAYYLDHRGEVDDSIREYHDRAQSLQASAGESPLSKRLRENRQA